MWSRWRKMKGWPKFLLLSITAIACAGCQAGARECAYLSEGYASLDGRIIASLEPYELDRIPPSIIDDVRNCWAEKALGGDGQYTLEVVEARRASPTGYYVIFEPRGITDVKLAFLVDDEKGVIGAYEYGVL